jgi:hypothetical protein
MKVTDAKTGTTCDDEYSCSSAGHITLLPSAVRALALRGRSSGVSVFHSNNVRLRGAYM